MELINEGLFMMELVAGFASWQSTSSKRMRSRSLDCMKSRREYISRSMILALYLDKLRFDSYRHVHGLSHCTGFIVLVAAIDSILPE